MRRHFGSGFPRALLSLSQEKSSRVEIGPASTSFSAICGANYLNLYFKAVINTVVQAVSDHVLNVTLRINDSIEGWAHVTIISPISGQQGTTVINIGHLDERHYFSAVQLDYYTDSISGYEISSVTNVNNYSEVIID